MIFLVLETYDQAQAYLDVNQSTEDDFVEVMYTAKVSLSCQCLKSRGSCYCQRGSDSYLPTRFPRKLLLTLAAT